MFVLELIISDEMQAFAQAMADRYGHFDARDYLIAMINMDMLRAMDEEDWPLSNHPVSPASDLNDDLPF